MAPTKNSTHLLIAGCGYVGREVLRCCLASPDCGHHPLTGTAGSTASIMKIRELGAIATLLDLDAGAAFTPPAAPWSLLYTVPPGRDAIADKRLAVFLDAIGSCPPERIVYLSTSGVYGDRGGSTVSEDDPVAPGSDRARRRMDAEARVRAFSDRHKIAWVVLRVPGIYGPGRLRLESIRSGEPVLRAEDCGPGNRIHRTDLALCCLAALQTSHKDRVFNVSDDEHASSCAFTLEVARQAGLPPPPQISMAEAGRRFSAMRLSFLEESRLLDNTRMHRELGVSLLYPGMSSGIAASLAEAPPLARA